MNSKLTRRDMIKGSVAFAALAFAQYPLSSFGFRLAGTLIYRKPQTYFLAICSMDF